ncbi:MAG: HlyD family efflux transporter periplasmic adaptor subunit [Succinivibrio sp.]
MRKLVVLFAVTALICALVLIYSIAGKADPLVAHGMVDIRQSSLGFERAGKIKALYFDESDEVKKGDVLAVLDTADLSHQIAIQTAKCDEAKAYLDQMESGYRLEEISQAKEAVQALTQSYELSKLTYRRNEQLAKSKSVSAQTLDESRYAMEKLEANLKEAQAKLSMMTKGYRQEEILRAQSQSNSCIASLEYLEYQKQDQSEIKAPFDGVIRARHSEVGEIVGVQNTVFELSMKDIKRVRVYVTEEQLSHIKAGMKATITTLSSEVAGKVAIISDTAMFTPKTVQTEQLRAELVYEVRIDTNDPDNILRYGQSVSVRFE